MKQTETALAELLTRDLTGQDIKVLMLDGEHLADTCVVVALAITADGRKLPVGLWDGASENKTVVRALLADLVSRGLSADDGLLVVIDGAKALAAAVKEVFGTKAAVQRCTLHKRRNVADHLPEAEKAWVDAKLVKAFDHPDPELGLRNAKHLAGLLDKTYPGAANSLREGLAEMFTVSRLGIDGRLAKTLITSNPVESMISIARTTNRNVTRWRDGHMVLRWTAAGMLNAERSFRRIKAISRCPSSSPRCTATRTLRRQPRTPKLSESPRSVHPGSPPKFHETRDILDRSRHTPLVSREPVHPDAIKIALDRTGGWQFEAFAQEFFAKLLGTQFVPLGGVKDGGADGFIGDGLHKEPGAETYFQASIEVDYRSKIRRTVARLREFGRQPSELIYATNRTVKYTDTEERSLSRNLGCTVRIRDGGYIATHVNDGPGLQATYEQNLAHLTDFLKSIGSSSLVATSAHVKSPAVYVFLEQELAQRSGDTRLVDAVTDSLILWALEGTDPDARLFMSAGDVLERVSREIPATRQVVEPRLQRRLEVLSNKHGPQGRQVRWHKKEDVFVLPFETRQRIQVENRNDESLRLDVLSSFYARLLVLAPDETPEPDLRLCAELVLRALQRTFEQEGLEFAHFLEDEVQGEYATVTDSIRDVLIERGVAGARGIALGELVYQVVRKVFYDSVEVEREYLGKLSRTYTLLFTLNTEPRLIEYFQDLTGHLNLFVGTDLIVRALSERYLPEADQMTRQTLRMASQVGAKLVLTDPVLEEVLGNLRAADYEFRNWFQAIEAHVNDLMARNADKIMIRSYFYARLNEDLGPRRPTSWPAFINQFCRYEDLHRSAAVDQLRRYLQLTFALEYDTEEELAAAVDAEQLQSLTESLLGSKPNAKLARNDALLALAVYARRRSRREDSSTSEFGYETWWLTSESTILRHTRELVRAHAGARYMMRPDFLLNFITLAPNAHEARQTLGHVFPSLLGIKLSRRVKDTTFHEIMGKVKEASQLEPARRAAAIADASNRLKGDFWKQYRVQLQEQTGRSTGSMLVATSETASGDGEADE